MSPHPERLERKFRSSSRFGPLLSVLVRVPSRFHGEHGQHPLRPVYREAHSPITDSSAVLVRHSFHAPNVTLGQAFDGCRRPFRSIFERRCRVLVADLLISLPPRGRLAQSTTVRLTS